jgi:localization factor PodJL
MYEAGLGVPEDRSAALDWYSAAAEQGNILAMHNLGVMFSQGIGGTPDFLTAVDWFTSAADHGIRDSQYNLGVIFARGIGVEPDLPEAYKWFAIAAAQGDNDAAARRDDVAAALTPEQLTAARASVTAWTIQSAPAAANTVEAPEGGWNGPEERVDAGDRGELVRTIQSLLADNGFDPGPADGVDGPRTRDAARAFQQAIGVLPTGIVDETLLTALANRAA